MLGGEALEALQVRGDVGVRGLEEPDLHEVPDDPTGFQGGRTTEKEKLK